ncbi:MAG TPA: ThuA domain-containing protein [Bryobacteraceae bacterium]|nr:ThuA domain-containing protein [Bryobacteraceae bacterium]
MKRRLVFPLLVAGAAGFTGAAQPRVLVYTRNHVTNGKGYVHENIATSVQTIRDLGSEGGFSVEHSEDPSIFSDDRLKNYAAIVFSNSNNEAFETDAQREAFQRFVRGGGGLVGIHSATGSERKWPWFWSVMGGRFVRHPKIQKFTVRVADPGHPATRGLPSTFEWEDECYYTENHSPALKPLLVTDPAKLEDPKKAEYPGDRFGDALPIAWYQTQEGGRQFYTALGHKKEHYADPLLRKQILGGILWVIGRDK